MDWNSYRFDRRSGDKPGPPPPKLLEVRWRIRGPSREVVECGIYKVNAPGVELRAAYGDGTLVRTRRIANIESARLAAAEWLEAILEKGNCKKLPLE